MNALLMASRTLQPLVDAPVWAVVLLKITAILGAAWVAHWVLWRSNPRWRVLLWRVTAVGLVALPAAAWLLPAFEIPVEPPRPAGEADFARLAASDGVARPESSMGVAGSPERPDMLFPLVHSIPRATPFAEPHGSPADPPKQSFAGPGSQAEFGSQSTWQAILLAVWFGGIAILALRWSVGHYRIGRMIRGAEPLPDAIRGECRRVARAVGCRGDVDVRQSARVRSPLLCGLRRPLLLLPPRMCEESYRGDLPAIFAHELTHVRFRDLLWNAVLHLVSVVLWLHPLVWRLRRAHLAACEQVCDAVSADFVGNVGEYCRTLARIAVESVALASPAGIAMARSSNVSRRLHTLRKKVFCMPLRRRNAVVFGLAALLAVALVAALQFGVAAPSPDASKDQAGDSIAPAAITVEGVVTTPDGKPAAGAAVGLFFGHQGSQFPRTTTDQNGRYRLAASKAGQFVGAHEAGKFTVAAAADGFVPAWKTKAADAEQQTVDLQLIKGEPIRLRVVEQDGKPVAGAKIYAVFDFHKDKCDALMLDYERPGSDRSAYSGQTDAEGRWSRTWAPNDQICLGIDKKGYPSKQKSFAPDKREHVVELVKSDTLRVRVVDGAGKPLAGTKLKAAFLGHKDDYTTDAEGAATIAVPPPNGKFLSLIAYPDGYPPVRKWWRNDAGNELIPAEFTFAYEQGLTIGGTVRNERGKPIQGAKVHLSISCGKYEQVGMCLALWDQVFLTDAQGRWRLEHVPQEIGRISVGLEHPDYISVPGPGEVSATENRTIRDGTAVMVMKKGLPVSGTVTDPEGKPVAGARVFLGEWYSPPRIETSTDQEGRYRFASLAPGGTVLTVVKPGLAPGLRSINVQSRMKPVDFQLEKGHALRVRVVGRDGKPIPGVFVTPDTWRGKRVLCDLEIRGRTDADGRWSWTWAPQDTVLTDFGLTGRVNYISIRHRPLAAQEAEHVVTLDSALTISGRVLDAETKQPVPSFRIVRGYMSTGSVEQIMWDRMEVREGKDGRYEQMISQPSRVHLVRIEADGYQPAVSREFKDNEGNVTYDFSLRKGRNLNVLVRLADGKPAPGAEMCLCPQEPGKFINMALFVKSGRFPHPDPTRPFMKTGSDGRVSIQPQDQRYLFVVLHDQGMAQGASEELAANPTIALKAWARLEGTIRRGTKPVPGAKVDVYPTETLGPQWGFLNFQEQTEADAQGRFVFAKLKPGKWCVRELPSEPGRRVGPSQHQKYVELAPGQTLNVTLGGTGRPVVGRIQWPAGQPPQGDLSRIGADLRPKMPEMPSPPKATRDQGPDAVRAWRKQWMESDEGKAWQEKAQQRAECPRMVSVNRDGLLRIEDAVQGEYELGLYVMLKDETMPWERPDLARYGCDFSIPKIPGGVSDQPLDLGNVAIEDKSPKKLPAGPVKPPPPQAPGTRSVGGLRDHFDLLRYVVATYKENKEKIQTWQGQATVEENTVYHRGKMGQEYTAKVQFVFDRARKSVRWNTTLEQWTRSTEGVKTPQPVPQISNGMFTPEGLYRLGFLGSPVNPAKRPRTLIIYGSDDPSDGRIQPQLYDFNPLFYLETSRGDVARDLSAYLGWVDHPGLGSTKVIREGDQVTIDMGNADSFNRYTLSLSQGCNPIRYEAAGTPVATWQYRWTYELRDGVWLPKTWTETVRDKNSRDSDRKVTFVENLVNQKVEPAAFSLSRLGLQRGDNIDDRRTGQKHEYEGE